MMKLQLLHGPGIINSRAKLLSLKKDFDVQEVAVFEKDFDVDQALGSLATLPLFSKRRLIVLENPPEDISLDLSLITYHSPLIFWFDHEISPKSLLFELVKKYQGQILFFEEARETSVFPFLDCLASKDKKAFIELQELKRCGFDIFYILTMTFYFLRNLVSTPKHAHEFVKKKLTKQRANFTLDKIKSLYQGNLEIEFKLKSGFLDQSQAEFLLINSFVN